MRGEDTFFKRNLTINCRGELIDLSVPKVMGVVNVTPDSFYDGGKNKTEKALLSQVEKHLQEGATFIDVGGYSSRPGAKHITEEEELLRVIPAIKSIVLHFPEALISIDTFRSEVARQAIGEGAVIVNDISAGDLDKNMLKVVAEAQVPYIAMHMKGTPQNMQQNPNYKDAVEELIYYFSDKLDKINSMGISDTILDVGFGFGKTLEDNYKLLEKLENFKLFQIPVLVGLSRKSMFYNLLDVTPEKALNATTAGHTIALQNGANILRVHDVAEAIETIKIVEKLKEVKTK